MFNSKRATDYTEYESAGAACSDEVLPSDECKTMA